jgi:hypothetical protein
VVEPCVSDRQSYQVPDLRSDAVCNTIETAVLRQGLAVCVAGASDIKDIEVTQVPHKVLLMWLQKVLPQVTIVMVCLVQCSCQTSLFQMKHLLAIETLIGTWKSMLLTWIRAILKLLHHQINKDDGDRQRMGPDVLCY